MIIDRASGRKELHMQSEIMTDHQFDGLLKMVIKVIEASKDKQEAIDSLKDMLKDKGE